MFAIITQSTTNLKTPYFYYFQSHFLIISYFYHFKICWVFVLFQLNSYPKEDFFCSASHLFASVYFYIHWILPLHFYSNSLFSNKNLQVIIFVIFSFFRNYLYCWQLRNQFKDQIRSYFYYKSAEEVKDLKP